MTTSSTNPAPCIPKMRIETYRPLYLFYKNGFLTIKKLADGRLQVRRIRIPKPLDHRKEGLARYF